MSDPRKNFVCADCHSIINDSRRPWGKKSKCPECIIKFRRAMKFIHYNFNMIQELSDNNYLPACLLLNYYKLYPNLDNNEQYEGPLVELCEKVKFYLLRFGNTKKE